jgi:hypothetical protein
MVEVSVIGIDHFTAGQGAAKHAHEKSMLAGPIPVRVLRAAQFHEYVPQLIEWGAQGDVAYVRKMRIQSVASRAVAQALVNLATDSAWAESPARSEPPLPEIAGPMEENLVDVAKLFVARRGTSLRIEGVRDPGDPDDKIWEDGSLLPNPHATLAGPTFEARLTPTTPTRRPMGPLTDNGPFTSTHRTGRAILPHPALCIVHRVRLRGEGGPPRLGHLRSVLHLPGMFEDVPGDPAGRVARGPAVGHHG